MEDYYSYVYRITHKTKKKHYLGARYCNMQSRFSTNPIEDLKIYQTSSTDIEFKEELKLFPERFKWKIVKIFDTAHRAINYESRFHHRLDVASHESFYNKHNQGCADGFSIYDNKEIYDIINDKVINIGSAIQFSIDNNIHLYNLMSHRTLISKNYCLLENIEHVRLLLENKLKFYKLFKYNDITKNVDEYEIRGIDLLQYIGPDYKYLLKGTINYVRGFYLDKHMCERDNKTHTLYKYNDILNTIETLEVKYNKGFNIIGPGFKGLTEGRCISVKGYYYSYDKCKADNNKIRLYTYNHKLSKIVEVELKICEGSKTVGGDFPKLVNRKQKMSNGFYLDKHMCERDYKIITLYKLTNNEISTITLFRKDVSKHFNGKSVSKLLSGKISYMDGHYLDYDLCEQHRLRSL